MPEMVKTLYRNRKTHYRIYHNTISHSQNTFSYSIAVFFCQFRESEKPKCPRAEDGFSTAYDCKGHELRCPANPNRVPLKCTVPGCSKIYYNMSSLNAHIKRHTAPSSKYHYCISKTHYRISDNTISHLKTPFRIAAFWCEFRGKGCDHATPFSSKAAAKQHSMGCEGNPARKELPCDVEGCGRVYFTPQSLAAHKKQHGQM